MRYTLKQIKYFIATAETGSITLASERVHISQPSISAAINNLEEELKTQLFIRHHAQGLTLTPAGKTILIQSRLLIAQAEQLYAVALDATNSIRGELTFGCMVTFASMIMPELILSFCSQYQEAKVNNDVGNHDYILKKLLNGDIDVALSYNLLLPDGLDYIELAELQPCVVIGENHPFASKKTIHLREIVHEPLLLLDLPLSREYFLTMYLNQDLKPNIGMISQYHDVLRTAAANGYGYTLSNVRPRSQIAIDGRGLKYIPLADNFKPMKIVLITLAGTRKTRLVQLFYEHCKTMISNNSIPGMIPPNAAY